MKNSLDQGTVIYGIKSDKYPAFPCYGIIITARCDIAQNKVPKYHYLVAVDASSWFSSKHGYQLVYSKTIADKMKTVCDKATALELDGQTLLDKHIFCIDLTACHLLLEETNPFFRQ